jgi:hypothetical protein
LPAVADESPLAALAGSAPAATISIASAVKAPMAAKRALRPLSVRFMSLSPWLYGPSDWAARAYS